MIEESFVVNSAQTSNPLLLTISQVADLLNLGRTKTYELVMSNRIKSVKLGRRRLVPRHNLEEYVAGLCDDINDD
jgi:excisionase family DNA binding protein